MKVYVLYESNYGELIDNNCVSSTTIIGIFDTLEKAKLKKQELIESEEEFIIDEDIKDNYNDYGVVTMFSSYQENWNCYYEIVIEEREVK